MGLPTMGDDGQALVADSTVPEGIGWAHVTPVGGVVAFAGPAVPAGWLVCDGASLRQSTYPDLYSAIGKTFGGSTLMFSLPDLKELGGQGKPPGLRWIVKT